MKKMNLLAMSLVSAAALSFSSCSSNDDLGGGAGTQSQVDGFYMTLAIQTPTSNGTRTVGDKTESAKDVEQAVKKGTFFLVDQNGHIAFSRPVDSSSKNEDETWNGATEKQNGTKLINIKVDKVVAGTTYKVYFLAGDQTIPAEVNPAAHTFTATETAGKFAEPFATANNFAMFNQNDKNVNGNGYTVVFTKDNKDKSNPATVTYKKDKDTEAVPNATIKIERITARIDALTGTASTIVAYDGTKELTQPVKDAMADAKAKVKSITLNKYAIANLTKKTNVMQQWNATSWDLIIPTDATPVWQITNDFGEKKLYADGGFKTTAEAPNNYVLENNSTTDPTKMYFEYKVTLNDELTKAEVADFTDGTFYRYNNIIFSSFKQIFEQYNDVTDIFGAGKTADIMKGELKAILEMPAGTERETALKTFRETYDIEVFDKGMTYYQKEIVDKNILAAGKSLIQRNTIYKVNVDKIFNIGVQVPNDEDEIDKKSLFYLSVTVSVNPWVLNTQDVELGD
ncbi:Mfa1 family fimbria major subunit [Segatella copri]|uniref:Mfa1 family fimbria major subunit n=1 Tax=Segatella copri TaxID=165179 RepID=UPI003F8A5CEE